MRPQDGPMTRLAAEKHQRYRHIAYQLRRHCNELNVTGLLLLTRAKTIAYSDYVTAQRDERSAPGGHSEGMRR